jgi:hypothetical protein
MRTQIVAGILLSVVGLVGHGQQAGRETVYIAPNIARTVVISRSGAVLTTLAVPQGTVISVAYDTARSVLPVNDGRFEFHGNVEVRVLASSEKNPTERLQQAMLQSPVLLTATGVDVEITPVSK